MQYGDVDGGNGTNGIKTPGAWEVAVEDGIYEVTVGVGDQPGANSIYDSVHVINVEGSVGIEQLPGDHRRGVPHHHDHGRRLRRSPHDRRARRHQHQDRLRRHRGRSLRPARASSGRCRSTVRSTPTSTAASPPPSRCRSPASASTRRHDAGQRQAVPRVGRRRDRGQLANLGRQRHDELRSDRAARLRTRCTASWSPTGSRTCSATTWMPFTSIFTTGDGVGRPGRVRRVRAAHERRVREGRAADRGRPATGRRSTFGPDGKLYALDHRPGPVALHGQRRRHPVERGRPRLRRRSP